MRLSMLPAHHGDCLWIEWGSRPRRRLLIDGGPVHAGKAIAARVPEGGARLELLVVTHVDADHIGGVLDLLAHPPPGLTIGDVWFNGFRHLPSDVLGATQGELLSALVERRGLPWNAAFGGDAVAVPDEGPLPRVELPGGLVLTLLSPTREELRRLRPKWEQEVEKAGLTAGDEEAALAELARRFGPLDLLGRKEGPPRPDEDARKPYVADTGAANGSSIALLAEHRGRSALLCADAPAPLVLRALARLGREAPLEVDAVKLAHHGSAKSTSAELVRAIRSPRWLVSTSGAIFGHPDNAALGRVIAEGGADPELIFNYRSERTALWDDDALRAAHGYRTSYPADGGEGITVEL